jgi:uncharacterized protein with HEPN domain
MSRHEDNLSLAQMLDYASAAIRMARGRTREDLDRTEMLRLALTRAIEVIGEAAGRVSQVTRDQLPAVPWSQIIGARNRLIHGYDKLDLDVLWSICSKDIPLLIAQLRNSPLTS